ncbi:MAG: hypothetical protein ACOC9S_04245 [Planctomycetota bacterium]
MDQQGKLSFLLNLARELGIIVRRVPSSSELSDSAGALVRLRGREMLMLNSSAPPAEQIAVVADAVRGRRELEDRFLPPEIRELIDGPETP